jgi:hypothetical protein
MCQVMGNIEIKYVLVPLSAWNEVQNAIAHLRLHSKETRTEDTGFFLHNILF